MSYTKIWVHVVWGTKGQQPILVNGMRQQFLDQIVEQATVKDIEIHLVNCWMDHIHCLIRLKEGQNVAATVSEIKRNSSRWINLNKISEKRFSWDKDFFAASVSEGNLNPVRNYILGQERQHENRSYQQEIEAYFMPTGS
ncbi:MAG: transposase [Bacteroidales bacterium]|nr:transposase [Bacteroidales bacterium]